MMKKANLVKWVRLWLLVITLIMPFMGMAESAKITVDPVVHDGQFVIFVLKNYEDRDFVCTFIKATATVKNHQGKGEVIARRSIVAENVILLVNSREKQVEVDKEFIKELENQFEQPRIVDVTVPTYSCESNMQYVTADKKVFHDRLKDGSYGPEMVIIPAGRFQMGNIQGDSYNYDGDIHDDEKPVHWVNIKSFAIGKYEVTVENFLKFVHTTGYKAYKNKEERELDLECAYNLITLDYDEEIIEAHQSVFWRGSYSSQKNQYPITCIHWDDAIAYTKWLSEQTGKDYRLPSEAEWEYAARAGTTTKYWWGNDKAYSPWASDTGYKDKARCHYEGDEATVVPVGSFKPNQFGLYDVVGNAEEWVADPWHDNYINAPNDGKVWTKGGSNRYKVVRNPKWYQTIYGERNNSLMSQCSYSFSRSPSYTAISYYRGFRLARHLVTRTK